MTPIHEHWLFEDLLSLSVNQIYVGPSCSKAKAFLTDFIESKQHNEHRVLIIGENNQLDIAQSIMTGEKMPFQRLSISNTIFSFEKQGSISPGSDLDILCQRAETRSHNLLIEVPEHLNSEEKISVIRMLKKVLADAILPSYMKSDLSGGNKIIDVKPSASLPLRVWIGHTAMPLAMDHVRGVAVMFAQARSSGIRVLYELNDIPNTNSDLLRENIASVLANTNEIAIGNNESLAMIRNMMAEFKWSKERPIFNPLMFGFDELGPMDVYLHSVHEGNWKLLSLRENRQESSEC